LKKNKIIITITVMIIVIVSLLFISWVYIGMNGLPWKVKQTEITASKYLSEKYPDLKYEVNKAHYNSKFGYYSCSIITEGNLPINFAVNVRGTDNIEDNYLQMKVNTEAKNMVVSLIKNSVPTIKQISVLEDAGAEAVNGSYEKYTSFIPGSAYPLKIDVLWDGDKMSLDTFVDKSLIVREILNDKNISVCGLYIQDDINGYVINLNGRVINGKMEGNYNLTKDEIMKSKAADKMK